MTEKPLVKWAFTNALGLGVGFVASLSMIMLIEFGFDFESYWAPIAPGQSVGAYAARLVGGLLVGLIFGGAQALILRSRLPRVVPWILATAAGFGLVVAVQWPLMAVDIWGRIPGPAEPILITVGGGSLAGILQYRALRAQGIDASRWLVVWIGGLVASLVPTALFFMSLEGLHLSISWPLEVFFSGFSVAGVAALISGKALFATILDGSSTRPPGLTTT